MIFPENFEQKIGFDEIRTLLKGRCMSTLGTEWVDSQLKFLSVFLKRKTTFMKKTSSMSVRP